MANEHSKRPSATKSGPGRYHQASTPGTRLTKPHAQRTYEALMAAWAGKRLTNWSGNRDDHGDPFTLVGRNLDGTRRTWLAGISAQRGH
jgi:hypothetical protein